MNPTTVHQMTERVSQLLVQRLGAKGHTLQARLQSRTRALPRRVRRAVELLVRAEALAASPKMIRQVDMEEISKAYDLCLRYLQPLGSGARLRGQALSIAASVLFALLVTAAAVLGVMTWRGLL
ncbi:MAG: hypothetical protein PHX82_00735 [Paracoccaceae bacterium]|jgi:hypothetical protein|nr:hypothetical protein [Paracoccaceae bacterium]